MSEKTRLRQTQSEQRTLKKLHGVFTVPETRSQSTLVSPEYDAYADWLDALTILAKSGVVTQEELKTFQQTGMRPGAITPIAGFPTT